jgi:hypothetical protein
MAEIKMVIYKTVSLGASETRQAKIKLRFLRVH